jgi:hypothetical protein
MTLFHAEKPTSGFVCSCPADERSALLRARVNLLISGSREATDAFVLAATPYFRLPIRRVACDAPLSLQPAGTLILDAVDTLDEPQQETLLRWLEEYSHTAVQVISLTPAALYTHVQAGTFLNALFYRLNVIYLEVSAAGTEPSHQPDDSRPAVRS